MFCHEAGSQNFLQMDTIEVAAVDETAAGDSFVGYCLATLAAGESMATALRYGTVAGALAVTKEGAAPSVPSPKEVEASLKKLGEVKVMPI